MHECVGYALVPAPGCEAERRVAHTILPLGVNNAPGKQCCDSVEITRPRSLPELLV